MKITYIGHSGFSVELDRAVLLFDYYTGKLPEWTKEKALLVFASHCHPDHFNWEILKLAGQYSEIHYFFGNDIRLGNKWLREKGIPETIKEKITRLSGGRQASYEEKGAVVKVSALKSTDSGVAFVVETEGRRLYHAGDLNWWHWNGEPDEENEAMGRAYRREIDTLAGEYFDAAFVPLDPRLGDASFLGIDYFIQKTNAGAIFPMHLWGEYETVARYKRTQEGEKAAGRIMDINGGGQEWNI